MSKAKLKGKKLDDLKVAIVCDWLTNMGGAERLVLELHKMFPAAPIYTSQYDAKKMPLFKDADVRTSWLNKVPFFKNKHQFFPLPRGWYFQSLKLDDFDLVISTSGAEAKAVKTGPDTLHINYCHSPTHYYWVRPDEYLENPGFGWFDPVMRLGLKLLIKRRRVWDYLAAQAPDIMIANSTITKKRIKKYYDRDAEVIFPPVDTERFDLPPPSVKREGYVVLGRQVHYMRKDLAVNACKRLDKKLVVVGNGPEHQKLVENAGVKTVFKTKVDDKELVEILGSAEAFIFPGVEDFGIAPVEAMACGTPVIAINDGGALDSVKEGVSGVFFEKQNVRSLSKAIKGFDPTTLSAVEIRNHALNFSASRFQTSLKRVLEKYI